MNIKTLLSKYSPQLKLLGLETAELDTRILLEEVIKKSDAFIFSHPEYELTLKEITKFKRLFARRAKGEPIAYITGHKEFFGLDFLVNKKVLVPRPESEWLVEKAIELLPRLTINDSSPTILDMGTGSGCLAIALSKSILNTKYQMLNAVKIYAVDFNNRAVAVAKKNAKRLKAHNIVFFTSDLLQNPKIKKTKFHLIIANLPYVPQKYYQPTIKGSSTANPISYEPGHAIFAKNYGMGIIKRFLTQVQNNIRTDGVILLETDSRNSIYIEKYASTLFPLANIYRQKDISGKNRYVVIKV